MEYIWMASDVDKYELPIAIAGSAQELARLINSTETTVRSLECKRRKGLIRNAQKYRIYRYEFEEKEHKE